MSLRCLRLQALLISLPLFVVGGAAAAKPKPAAWVGTWGAAPSLAVNDRGALAAETTLREIVHVSRGGSSVRVTLTNELGTDPLTVSGARVAARAQGNTLVPGSDHALTFGGEPSIVIPPGAVAVSDPVDMKVAALSDLAITLLLPAQPLHAITVHNLALETNYQATGDQLAGVSLEDASPIAQWRFLKNVEVSGAQRDGAIIAFGDSITDGHKSTPNGNDRWPDELARRIQADKSLSGLGVMNEGISGNRILHDIAGPNGLARFDRDVLSQSGVRYLIILEGINDIGRTAQPRNPGDEVTTQQIIVALGQMIERAHAHGIKVYGATLTPFVGATYQTAAGETMRQAVNTWIRTSGRFDGVIDFDKATRDPANPSMFLPAFDSGDHLHPGVAGYKAMGDSIDLKLFGQ